jgi:hypothetical protein
LHTHTRPPLARAPNNTTSLKALTTPSPYKPTPSHIDHDQDNQTYKQQAAPKATQNADWVERRASDGSNAALARKA